MEDFPQEFADEFSAAMVTSLGEQGALRQLALMSGYTDVPPSIDDFIDKDYYLGKVLGNNLYPAWRQELRAIYPNPFYSPYTEIVLGGAVGIGKSSMSLGIQAYDLCKLLYLEDPHQKFQILSSQEIVIAFFNAPQPLTSTVVTPEGFKTMGDVCVGDVISNPDGKTSRVIGVYPQGKRRIYKIKLHDGREVRCDENHVWLVRGTRVDKYSAMPRLHRMLKEQQTQYGDHLPKGFLLMTTKQLIEELGRPRSERFHISIPTTMPVEFSTDFQTPLSQDPYLIGLLIGDGCMTMEYISYSTKDQELADYVVSQGFIKRKDRSDVGQFGAKGVSRKVLVAELKSMGIFGCGAGDKFLPNRLLFGSIEERKALLQGLFDTDGCCSTRGTCSYLTISKQLAEDIRQLVESLGGISIIHELPARESPHPRHKEVMLKNNKPQYIVHCRLGDNGDFFRLSRKKVRAQGLKNKTLAHRIVSIEEDGFEECACIKVDHPNHLYLTDNFVVTHNTLRLAQSVLYNQFKFWLTMSPFFREQRGKCKNPRREFLPNRLGMIQASRSSHVLGTAIVGGILSELEYMDKVKHQPIENFTQVQMRMQSRFDRGEGFLEPGHLVIDSSARYSEGFMAQHMLMVHGDPRVKVIAKSIWDVLEPAGKIKLSGKKFHLFVGDPHRDPMIVEGIGSGYNIPPELVMEVPAEYRKFFEQDIFNAVRNLAGRSTMNIHKFFMQIQMVYDAMTLQNPCQKEVVELDFDNDDDRLINYVDLTKLDKSAVYYIHFDTSFALGKNKTGIAMTCKSGDIVVNRVGNMLDTSVVQDTIYRTDLVLAIQPKPGKEIPLAKLRNFLIDLTHAHIKIGCVSADTFQSKQILQEAKKYGLAIEDVSVDRTREPYDQFKNIILEKRWIGPIHPILRREFTNLIDVGKKIDHPSESDNIDKATPPSKDMTDAVVGSVYLCKEKSKSDTGMQALEAYMKATKAAEVKATVTDHILDLAQRNKRQNKFF